VQQILFLITVGNQPFPVTTARVWNELRVT